MLTESIWMRRDLVRRAVPFLAPKLTSLRQHAPRPLRLPRDRKTNWPCPTISIVTPSYQQAAFIERTILSVSAQEYPDLEHIVIDGGSSDETTTILARNQSNLSNWISEADGGQAEAINKGFRLTHGEILSYLNSDDLLLPGALDAVAQAFAEAPDLDVIYGHRILIDENDLEIGRWIVPAHDNETLKWADWIPQETLFWRRRAWDRIGGALDETLRFAMDWDLVSRFDRAGLKIRRLNRFLGAFRVHENQKTLAEMATAGQEEMRLIRKRYLGRDADEREIRRRTASYLLRHVALDLSWRAGLVDLES